MSEQTKQDTPVSNEPEQTQYWLYDSAGYYTGKTVKASTCPANGARFEPKLVQGTTPWFDGVGWRALPDLRSPDLPLSAAKSRALSALEKRKFSEPDAYPPGERATFDAQYAEAQVVSSGGEAGPYLTAIAAATGEKVTDLAKKVLAKRKTYDEAMAKFGAEVQAMRNRIEAATTAEELPTYLEITGMKQYAA